MPEPVSVVVVSGALLLSCAAQRSVAASSEGAQLRRDAVDYQRGGVSAVSRGPVRTIAMTELADMLDEHGEAGWDGIRAPAPDDLTVAQVVEVLEALPESIPDPEFSIDPDDGAVSLDWSSGYRTVATLSIHGGRRAAFYALRGRQETQGAYDLDDGRLPAEAIEAIARICHV